VYDGGLHLAADPLLPRIPDSPHRRTVYSRVHSGVVEGLETWDQAVVSSRERRLTLPRSIITRGLDMDNHTARCIPHLPGSLIAV